MKLKDWARANGISYRTAWRWFHNKQLPVQATQTASGTILVSVDSCQQDGTVALYARVSSGDQRADLERQVARLTQFAVAEGWHIGAVVTEVGSALNGKRPKLKRLLADPTIHTIVVEHRDRHTRFGFDYIVAALGASGRCLRVVEVAEVRDDLVRDMLEVLTSFCARLYGRRSAKHRAAAALATAQG